MNFDPVAAVVNAASLAVDKLAAAQNSGRFVVDKDNVLAAAQIIQAQADSLVNRINGPGKDLRVEPPGTDSVSEIIALEWNNRLVFDGDSYTARVQDYVQGLYNLVTQLKDTALAYGYNEDEVAVALGKTSA